MIVSKVRREPASEGSLILDIQPSEVRYDVFLPSKPPDEGTLSWQPQQRYTFVGKRGCDFRLEVCGSSRLQIGSTGPVPQLAQPSFLHLQNATSDGFVVRN